MCMCMCKRCGYETAQKSNLIRHLQKKIPCEPNITDVSLSSLIEEATHKEYNDITYSCDYCDKKFNFNQSRHRHQKICKSNNGTNNKKKKSKAVLKNEKQRNLLIEQQLTIENLKDDIKLLQNTVRDISSNVMFLNDKRNEAYYQKLLEIYFKAGHKK